MLARSLALLLVLLLVLPGAAADEDFARLKLLDDDELPGHEAAMAWWDGRTDAQQLQVLQRALASKDRATALVAARALPHPYTTGAELRRRQHLLNGDLAASFGAAPDWGFSGAIGIGSDDVVELYRTAAASETLPIARSTLDGLHRCARAEHAIALVDLLVTPNLDVFTSIVFTLANLGDFDRQDSQRAAIARGLLYGLRRLRAERAGKPMPKLWDTIVRVEQAPGDSLPAALIEIARAQHPAEKNGFSTGDNEKPLSIAGPLDWLRRWMVACTPGAQDVEFLHEVVEVATGGRGPHGYHDGILLWAMRHLHGRPEARGRAVVEAWAGEQNNRGLFAAAALALAGSRARFDERVKANPDDTLDALCWIVDRDLARERTVARIAGAEIEDLKSGDVLSFLGRAELERFTGARVTLDDLTWIGDALWKMEWKLAVEETSALRLVWFHTVVDPGGLTRDRGAALLRRLEGLPAQDWTYASHLEWERLFALLEVQQRDGTIHLLEDWVKTQPGRAAHFLPLLARLGVPGHETAMFAAWPEWDPVDQCALGRVPGDAVEAFLKSKRSGEHETKGDPVHESWVGLCALLWRAGLPAALAPLFESIAWEYDDDDEEEIRARREKAWSELLAGDAVASVLTLAEGADRGLHALGTIDDGRVSAWIRKRRATRLRGDYWQATAAAATRDQRHTRTEVRRLLASGRTWILSDLEGAGLGQGDRSGATRILLKALDTNCCLGWAAGLHLKVAWPWFNVHFGMAGPGMRHTRAFIEGHSWEHSRILGGPVPAGR